MHCYIVVHLHNHCCHKHNSIFPSYCCADIGVNNIEVFIVVMEVQQWVLSALLSGYVVLYVKCLLCSAICKVPVM